VRLRVATVGDIDNGLAELIVTSGKDSNGKAVAVSGAARAALRLQFSELTSAPGHTLVVAENARTGAVVAAATLGR
jgi:hypothetical protein